MDPREDVEADVCAHLPPPDGVATMTWVTELGGAGAGRGGQAITPPVIIGMATFPMTGPDGGAAGFSHATILANGSMSFRRTGSPRARAPSVTAPASTSPSTAETAETARASFARTSAR